MFKFFFACYHVTSFKSMDKTVFPDISQDEVLQAIYKKKPLEKEVAKITLNGMIYDTLCSFRHGEIMCNFQHEVVCSFRHGEIIKVIKIS